MKLLLVFLLVLIKYSAANYYDGCKVFDLYPRSHKDQYALEMLWKRTELDFWIKRPEPNQVWTVVVPPFRMDYFLKTMKRNDIDYVEKIIDLKDAIVYYFADNQTVNVSFNRYPNYNSIHHHMKSLAESYPKLVTLLSYNVTQEGREILGLKISRRNETNPNFQPPGILITGGLNPREWIGPIMALYIIQQLLTDHLSAQYYENVNWYIFPLMNPDGYEYTMVVDRLWEKNLSPNPNCAGVDLTKNFDCAWGEASSTFHQPCHPEYIGPNSFSEPETRALRNFLNESNRNIKLYLSLRAFGPALTYPASYTSKELNNKEVLKALGMTFSQKVLKFGTYYPVQADWSLYNIMGGTDTDWMKYNQQVPIVYTLHLPPGSNNFFDPPPWEIKATLRDTYHGIPVLAKFVSRTWGYLYLDD